MSTSKQYNLIAIIAMAIATAIALAMYIAVSVGGASALSTNSTKKYATTLFDTSVVHTIDLKVDDWDSFIKNCENEEYISCDATIDGTTVQVTGLRAKGNTSLSSVSSMGSQRYSFKLEFDHYNKGGNYDGLDKLSLNNCIQDTTYMKDYLTYTLMGEMGVDAPLCSYAYITVNGEDWGLYLAVEGVEESYLERTKSGKGELYKPDNMSMGAGAGNGKGFNMDDFNAKREGNEGNASGQEQNQSQGQSQSPSGNNDQTPNTGGGQTPNTGGFSGGQAPDMGSMGGQTPPSTGNDNAGNGNATNDSSSSNGNAGNGGFSSGFNGQTPPEGAGNFSGQMPEGAESFAGQTPPEGGNFSFGGKGGFGGMGSGGGTDLKYIDDNLSSYSSIFNNSVTDTTVADQNRVVNALKTLNEQTNVDSAVDVDQVLRYFAAHNFVVNSDSYTGTMIHNYYLYENDGKLSMIPWDYNLSFGTFTASNATSSVNDAIDSPLEASGDGSLPMFDFIVNDEKYLNQYHQYLQQLCDKVDLQEIIDKTSKLIAPYVAKDATAFYSYEEYEQGVTALKSFCDLRVQSVKAQLNGTIAATDAARSDNDKLIDASNLNLSDMGSMGGGKGGGMSLPGNSDGAGNGNFPGGDFGGFQGGATPPDNSGSSGNANGATGGAATPSGSDSAQSGATTPNGSNSGPPSGGMTPPSGSGGPTGTPSR